MKVYWLTCPVCRVAHSVEAEFLSSPRSLLSTDGRILPSQSCGRHTAEELQTAWKSAAMREP